MDSGMSKVHGGLHCLQNPHRHFNAIPPLHRHALASMADTRPDGNNLTALISFHPFFLYFLSG